MIIANNNQSELKPCKGDIIVSTGVNI